MTNNKNDTTNDTTNETNNETNNDNQETNDNAVNLNKSEIEKHNEKILNKYKEDFRCDFEGFLDARKYFFCSNLSYHRVAKKIPLKEFFEKCGLSLPYQPSLHSFYLELSVQELYEYHSRYTGPVA